MNRISRAASLVVTLAHGVFLAFILGSMVPESVVTLKAMIDIGSLLPQWSPKKPPAWMARAANWMDRKTGHRPRSSETFEQFWERTDREQAARFACDEEVVEGA